MVRAGPDSRLLFSGPGTRPSLWRFGTGFKLLGLAAYIGLAALALLMLMLMLPLWHVYGFALLLERCIACMALRERGVFVLFCLSGRR